jgi:hypothetical protein
VNGSEMTHLNISINMSLAIRVTDMMLPVNRHGIFCENYHFADWPSAVDVPASGATSGYVLV